MIHGGELTDRERGQHAESVLGESGSSTWDWCRCEQLAIANEHRAWCSVAVDFGRVLRQH
jgi:hypothetical protein